MTYRDDHDAALARADALEHEVEELKRDRDKLAHDLEEEKAHHEAPPAPTPKPKPPATSSSSRAAAARRLNKRIMVGGAVVTLGVTIFIAVVLVGEGKKRSARADYRSADALRDKDKARWDALLSLEPCVRDVFYNDAIARQYLPDYYDPRVSKPTGASSYIDMLASTCLQGPKWLVADTAMPKAVTEPLKRWLAAETKLAPLVKPLVSYYAAADWKDDDFKGGPLLWEKLTPALDTRRALLREVRTSVLPVVRRMISDRRGATHDVAWWAIEIGLEWWAVEDTALGASGVPDGKEPDLMAASAAAHEPAAGVLEHIKQAPPEAKHAFRLAFNSGATEWLEIIGGGGYFAKLGHLKDANANNIDPLRIVKYPIPGLPPKPERPAD